MLCCMEKRSAYSYLYLYIYYGSDGIGGAEAYQVIMVGEQWQLYFNGGLVSSSCLPMLI